MSSSLFKLLGSYLIIGILIFVLAHLKEDPKTRSITFTNIVFFGFVLLLIGYVLPFCVLVLYSYIKIVLIQKYTFFQFKEHVIYVLFEQFNGYYISAWDWIITTLGKPFKIFQTF
jgi:hypothetical protein